MRDLVSTELDGFSLGSGDSPGTGRLVRSDIGAGNRSSAFAFVEGNRRGIISGRVTELLEALNERLGRVSAEVDGGDASQHGNEELHNCNY